MSNFVFSFVGSVKLISFGFNRVYCPLAKDDHDDDDDDDDDGDGDGDDHITFILNCHPLTNH